jgi:hypothetical protein
MEYKEIKKLMEDMGNSKLSELEIEFSDGIKIMEVNLQTTITHQIFKCLYLCQLQLFL